MKLLICTQAVDKNDPILGFFHRWIEEFAKHCEQVTVICLREGEHELPKNVTVCSLGKITNQKSNIKHRLIRAFRFWKLIFGLQGEYDAVFVHMNPEYVVLGGVWWRLWGKRIGLWYVHKSVDLKLRMAEEFADVIFTASLESFRLPSKKVQVVGHGIDTDFFSSDASVERTQTLLSVGRLDKTKRHDFAIRAAALAHRELRIAGDGAERDHLEVLAREVNANVTFLGGVTQEQLRDEYRKAAFLIHASETGSMDKVTLEALACDLAVITTSNVYLQFPVHTVSATPEAIAEALTSPRESSDRVRIIREQHSLQSLIPKIVVTLSGNASR